MTSIVRKWGNSLGVRIPRSVAEAVSLESGTQVEIKTEAGRIIITPAAPRYTLEDLLKRVSKKNLHEEIDFGTPQGKEAW
ncbi:MAG TPA: AbrB/MazE/SpoVT family DNA-binding domain-containing protein [Phycisphaerae bacterium]|nr:AbrB/MazE/SpoVT family DNA-binding domain-containing protein [Phycisphaerae bacterium]HOJ73953.1 AbrB/MazE/SpoVT family DNA-binding domain-containing protein [Phycisphaerae bacterium]HOM50894.1 AbrB/MazE/SpoVT family DNA-binding domain-containing protein [Phycisphaerae bacterium]HON65545.1 AbrB/MazE/SpoVT family DNA-binding domain-containing protein [Phycisphaerae bacterium]HOQ85621.1 AbrB/MazE/SpoVT family DNA-binding domain-containing protein [Phycisphaerae bacterium]